MRILPVGGGNIAVGEEQLYADPFIAGNPGLNISNGELRPNNCGGTGAVPFNVPFTISAT